MSNHKTNQWSSSNIVYVVWLYRENQFEGNIITILYKMAQISAIRFDGQTQYFTYDTQPFECPFCHKSITARLHQGFQKNEILEIVFRCPDANCGRIFFGVYKNTLVSNSWIYVLKSTSIGTFVEKIFSENISNLSSNFVDIYNQASKAESFDLYHIAGIG